MLGVIRKGVQNKTDSPAIFLYIRDLYPLSHAKAYTINSYSTVEKLCSASHST